MSDTLTLTEKALNYYHKNFYHGKEHEYITLMYFDNIFWDIASTLAKSSNQLQKTNGKNVVEKYLKCAKKRTLKRRKELFDVWKNNIKNNVDESCISNKFMVYLVKQYKVLEEENNVKKELDLI